MSRADEYDRIYKTIGDITIKTDNILDIISANKDININKKFIKINKNIGTILNNKFIKIDNFYKENNIDLYTESIFKLKIEKKLMNMANEALNILIKYSLELNIYSEHKINKLSFFGFRSKKEKKEDELEVDNINRIAKDYEKICSKLNNYSIDKNIVSNIIEFIEAKGVRSFKHNYEDISIFLDELNKLDLNDQTNKLKELLKEKNYYEILPNNKDIIKNIKLDPKKIKIISKKDYKINKTEKKIKNVDKEKLKELKEEVKKIEKKK